MVHKSGRLREGVVYGKKLAGLALLKLDLLCHLSEDFVTIIHDHAGWSVTGKRKLKNISHFWPKRDRGGLRNLSSGLVR